MATQSRPWWMLHPWSMAKLPLFAWILAVIALQMTRITFLEPIEILGNFPSQRSHWGVEPCYGRSCFIDSIVNGKPRDEGYKFTVIQLSLQMRALTQLNTPSIINCTSLENYSKGTRGCFVQGNSVVPVDVSHEGNTAATMNFNRCLSPFSFNCSSSLVNISSAHYSSLLKYSNQGKLFFKKLITMKDFF